MKIPKEKVKVKIKTDTSIIIGYIHTMVGGRLSDYMSAQKDKFIPITEATVFPLEKKIEEDINIKDDTEVVFVNVKKIEMLVRL